ncbi:signal peptidase I [Lachnoclostridium sp. Marseille-P6806]|uniref:signal peptidase I n=1 Tax=Lachnoclostridium sp. Marseille-P6806 TaxID=2364793 RepID=UPI0010324A11|nr:signal peptidase I [Lachnoclostridium sp. Marseille-P6806]
MRRKNQGLSFYERKRRLNSGIFREILLWIVYTAVAVLLGVVFVICFGFRILVIGQSMEPQLVNEQNVLIDRVMHRLTGIHRGDVIAFYPGGNTGAHPYVKRVVGEPGDVIQIIDGELMVGGVPDVSSGKYDKMEDAGIAAEAIHLQDGEYFVLGDNRNNSEDSRSAGIGAVTESSILGRAWLSLPEGDSGMGRIR